MGFMKKSALYPLAEINVFPVHEIGLVENAISENVSTPHEAGTGDPVHVDGAFGRGGREDGVRTKRAGQNPAQEEVVPGDPPEGDDRLQAALEKILCVPVDDDGKSEPVPHFLCLLWPVRFVRC